MILIACPECGAAWQRADACTARFHHFLALEFERPAYGAVHHLTVIAYMLQHPSHLSRRGWLAQRALLGQFLAGGCTPDESRRRNRERFASGTRSWSITKGERVQLPEGFRWSRTILDVPDESAEVYGAGVEAWARQVLAEAAAFEGIGGE